MPIGAMAFSPDGEALWVVDRGSIFLFTWPALELRVQVTTSDTAGGRRSLAFHPAGRMAAIAFGGRAVFLGMDAQPLRPAVAFDTEAVMGPVAHSDPLGIAFDGHGRLLLATRSGVVAQDAGGGLSRVGVPPNGPLPTDIWRAAVLPQAQLVVYCVNDALCLAYSWADGSVRNEDEWMGALATPDENRSWLGADASLDERALVFGKKSGATWIAKLEKGTPVSVIEAEKLAVRRPEGLKLAMRTTVHAVHPAEDAFVFAEISGYVCQAKLSTGRIVRELPRTAGGYAWE